MARRPATAGTRTPWVAREQARGRDGDRVGGVPRPTLPEGGGHARDAVVVRPGFVRATPEHLLEVDRPVGRLRDVDAEERSRRRRPQAGALVGGGRQGEVEPGVRGPEDGRRSIGRADDLDAPVGHHPQDVPLGPGHHRAPGARHGIGQARGRRMLPVVHPLADDRDAASAGADEVAGIFMRGAHEDAIVDPGRGPGKARRVTPAQDRTEEPAGEDVQTADQPALRRGLWATPSRPAAATP